MKILSILVLALFLLLSRTNVVRASSFVPRDFDQLVSRADTVFKGIVSTKNSEWTGEGSQRHIVTFISFRVEETYKGMPEAVQTLRFLGGTVGDDTMEVADVPEFTVGQTAILFVVDNGKQFCPLVGVAQGRFRVTKEMATGRERVSTDDGSPVVNTREIGQFDGAGVPKLRRYAHTGAEAMTAEQFKTEILGKLATSTR